MAHRVFALEEAQVKTANALESVAHALTLVTDLQRRFEDHERESQPVVEGARGVGSGVDQGPRGHAPLSAEARAGEDKP